MEDGSIQSEAGRAASRANPGIGMAPGRRRRRSALR